MNSLFENLLNRTVQGHGDAGRGQQDNEDKGSKKNAPEKPNSNSGRVIRPMTRSLFEASDKQSAIDLSQEETLSDGKRLLKDDKKNNTQEIKSEPIDVGLAQNFTYDNKVYDENISNARLEELLEHRLLQYKKLFHAHSRSDAGLDVQSKRIADVISIQNDIEQHKVANVDTTPVTDRFTNLHGRPDGLTINQLALMKPELENKQSNNSVSFKRIENTEAAVDSSRDFDSLRRRITFQETQQVKTGLSTGEQTDINSADDLNVFSSNHINRIQADLRVRQLIPEKVKASNQPSQNAVDVSINIGRVEIRAVTKADSKDSPDSAESMNSKASNSPAMTLNGYLKKRDVGDL